MDAAIASQHDVKTSTRKTMLILWVKFSACGGVRSFGPPGPFRAVEGASGWLSA